MLAADECHAIGTQQLHIAPRAKVQGAVEATDVGNVYRRARDAAEAGAGKAPAEHKGGLPGRTADERLADEKSQIRVRTLGEVVGAIAEVTLGTRRCGAQMQLPR